MSSRGARTSEHAVAERDSVTITTTSGETYRIARWSAVEPERPWASLGLARAVLQATAASAVTREVLRSLLHALGVAVRRLGDADVRDEVLARIGRRELALVLERRRDIPGRVRVDTAVAAAAPDVQSERPESKRVGVHWIEVVLLDEEGYPVSGVDYELELPDGRVRRGATNSQGSVRADNIAAGTCSFSYSELDTHLWDKTAKTAPKQGRPALHVARSWGSYDAFYTVSQGDSVESVAARAGHLWSTIWNHEKNAELRRARRSGHVLHPGDRLFVPRREPRFESLATDAVHTFEYHTIPSKLRIRFLHLGQPRRGLAYVFEVDGERREGVLDGDGLLEQPLSPVAQRAAVRFKDKEPSAEEPMVRAALAARGHEPEVELAYEEAYRIDLRHLDPASTLTGAQGRLRNYGFDIGEIDGVLGRRTHAALLAFQGEQGLEPTGELDEPTRQKLHAITQD